jgi:hypothetical protein
LRAAWTRTCLAQRASTPMSINWRCKRMNDNVAVGPPPSGRQRLPTITVERPRCPACGGTRLRKYRSISDQGDGSALAYVRCGCGKRFRVVME